MDSDVDCHSNYHFNSLPWEDFQLSLLVRPMHLTTPSIASVHSKKMLHLKNILKVESILLTVATAGAKIMYLTDLHLLISTFSKLFPPYLGLLFFVDIVYLNTHIY